MDNDWEAEVRRQAGRNRTPRVAVIVAAQHADTRPGPSRACPLRPAAMVLHVEPSRRVLVARHLVDALAKLRIRIRGESRSDTIVRRHECLAPVLAQIMAAG